MDWIANNIGMIIGWVVAVLTAVWGIATKFQKMEQRDESQEMRIQKLEREHQENHKLHLSNETRLVQLEAEVRLTKDTVVNIDKKLSDLQTFLMDKMK